MRLQTPTAILALSARLSAAQDASALTVQTTSGTYTGLVNRATAPDVHQWLGIPYAQPPARFMPPQRAVDRGAGLAATAYRPICMQDSGNRTGAFWELVPEFQNTDPQSEDCLYLNIWGPRKPEKKKLPVIVWVCGGAFKEGGGHAPYQVPEQWIQRTGTHLVVTFNARLNVFGFPGAPTGTPNAGLLDVRLVVEWLRDNVEGFGGDPNRMVLYGQSAGGGTVLQYAYANPTDPIVSGFIASSAGINNDNVSPVNPGFHDVAQKIGCANLTDAAEFACMQKVDAVKLRDAVVGNSLRFGPALDNVTVMANLTDRLEKGLVAKVPLITGFTFNEPAAFAPFDINATGPPEDTSGAPLKFGCGVLTEAEMRTKYGLTTYTYLYAGNFTNITPRYWLGGMHSSDIPIVFGTHYQFRGNSTEFEWQTSFAMQSMWVTFAANSSAQPRDHLGQAWPKYTANDGQIMVFGNNTGPGASYVAPKAAGDVYAGSC